MIDVIKLAKKSPILTFKWQVKISSWLFYWFMIIFFEIFIIWIKYGWASFSPSDPDELAFRIHSIRKVKRLEGLHLQPRPSYQTM